MKKIYFAVILSVLAIAVVTGGSRLRAHATVSSAILLSQLAGSFAGQTAANYGRCFNKSMSALQSCSKTPASQVVPWLSNSTIRFTSDAKGNSCGEQIGANAPLSPGPAPAGNSDSILVGVTTSYNPVTGSGQIAYKYYTAGPGVSCKGAIFVNTAKAPVVATATINFVVSEDGNRWDWITLAIHTAKPVDYVAGYVAHASALRQTSPAI